MGPFQNAFERGLAAHVLRRMTLILLREDTSVKLLASMGVSKNVARLLILASCWKALATSIFAKCTTFRKKRLLVGVTVPVLAQWQSPRKLRKSRWQSAGYAHRDSQCSRSFYSQVTATKGDDDRITSGRVHDLMQHTRRPHSSTTSLIIITLRRSTISFDILLGTRFSLSNLFR